MRVLSLMIALLVVACAGAPSSSVAPKRDARSATLSADTGTSRGARPPAPVALWLRVDDDTRERVVPTVAGSELLVELLPNGSLRTAAPSERREVKIPESTRRWPSKSSGLGLYVQRKVDVFLGSADGPVIGTALPGAFLPVIAHAYPMTEVALPGYKVRNSADSDPVRVFVDTSALGTDAIAMPPADPPGADFRDHELPVWASEDAPAPFTSTACGALRVVKRDGDRTQITQYADGVEVQGWLAKEPEQRRGDNYCTPRVVRDGDRLGKSGSSGAPPIPPGYVAVASGSSRNPLRSAIENGASVFWLIRGEEDDLQCVEWRSKLVSRAGSNADSGASRFKGELRRTVDKDRRLVSTFELGFAGGASKPSNVTLRGPTSFIGTRTTATALCGEGYTVVESAADHVTLVRGNYPRGIVAYHPDDTEIWYLSRERCAAAAKSNGAPAGASHVHQGC